LEVRNSMGAPQDFGQMTSYLRLTGKRRLELPSGEFIQRAEPPAKVGRAQAALPVQLAQKFFGGPSLSDLHRQECPPVTLDRCSFVYRVSRFVNIIFRKGAEPVVTWRSMP
jgi:hypothetical protein